MSEISGIGPKRVSVGQEIRMFKTLMILQWGSDYWDYMAIKFLQVSKMDKHNIQNMKKIFYIEKLFY